MRLRLDRHISFEEVLFHVGRGDLLDVLEHPSPDRYAGQRLMVVEVDGYVYLVPFVQRSGRLFLKTIIPSRKATRQYLGRDASE